MHVNDQAKLNQIDTEELLFSLGSKISVVNHAISHERGELSDYNFFGLSFILSEAQKDLQKLELLFSQQ